MSPRKQVMKFVPKTNQPDFHLTEAWDSTFSPDGLLAATTVGGRGSHEIYLWKTADGGLEKRLSASSWLRFGMRAAWSTDGKTVSWDSHLRLRPGRKPTTFDLQALALGAPLPLKEVRPALLRQAPWSLERLDNDSVQVLKDDKPYAVLKQPPGVLPRACWR